MWAISVAEPHKLALLELPAPVPSPGEVLLRIGRAGICGSDMHIFHGLNPFARYPRVIGHEAMGSVAAVGPGVHDLIVGDRVVIDPVVSCGHCHACRIGRPNVCGNLEVIGVHRDGGMRQLAVVPAANALKLPDGVTDRAAAMAEPYAVAANVMLRTEASPDDVALIYGAGVVGLTVLELARRKGIPCILVDIDDARLARATAMGATRTVNSTRESVEAAVGAETAGYGVTLVVDGAGAPGILEQAVRLAGPAGRIAVLNFAPGMSAIAQQEVTKKELSILGSRLNRRLMPQVLAWFAAGGLHPESLVTHEIRYDQVLAALQLIEQHPEQVCKLQLIFD
jgi:L-gulonate 5-dehydrogenase